MRIKSLFQFISKIISLFIALLSLTACAQKQRLSVQEIVDKSIEAHGHKKFEEIHLEFTFRDYQYVLHRDAYQTIYSRETSIDSQRIRDVYPPNDKLVRYIDGQAIALSDSIVDLYQNSLNAVMYFMELPYKLNDPPTIKEYKGEKFISDNHYHSIQVTFQTNESHQDVYYYWINQKTYLIDYFAYSFQNDGGGTRFRKAVNRRYINDVVFQDYKNFRPKEKFVPLENLPDLFVGNQLILVSEILKKNISIH